MTKQEWKALAHYMRWVANEIGLRDWHLTLSHEHTSSDDGDHVLAQVDVIYGRRYAVIKVCSCFRRERPEDQRMTIVHELVHCHIDPIAAVVRCELFEMKRLLDSEYGAIKHAHHRAVENATDAIAQALSPYLPLVDWTQTGPKSKRARKRCPRRSTSRS